MNRKQKRYLRRLLHYRIAALAKIIQDPLAMETGCDLPGLQENLRLAQQQLRRINRVAAK